MAGKDFSLTFRGVRGSRCCASENTLRYGGNTTCLELRMGPDKWLILDCGTGLLSLEHKLAGSSGEGKSLSSSRAGTKKFEVLLTHYHRDHLEGLPLFEPLYDPHCSFAFYGFPWEGRSVREVLEGAITPPLFPRSIQDTASSKAYVDLTEAPLKIGNLSVRTARVHHPQGTTAYRLDHDSGSVVFATDTEYGDPECDDALVDLSRGVGVLIHDAHFTPDEYESRRGQGHSTWRHAVEVARKSDAGRLVLFHHDPNRTDDELDSIVEEARKEFPEVEAAREGAAVCF